MHRYNIILEFDFPFDTEEYRTAPELELKEAHWMVRTFPFEEPEYLQIHPEEGPAPHILFINATKGYYFLVSYEGNFRYKITAGIDKGDHRELKDLGLREVQEAIAMFWDSSLVFADLWKKIKTVHHKYTLF